jgi:hypothetical protein
MVGPPRTRRSILTSIAAAGAAGIAGCASDDGVDDGEDVTDDPIDRDGVRTGREADVTDDSIDQEGTDDRGQVDDIDALLREADRDQIRIPPGTYEWNGTGLTADSRIVGGGDRGDVVLELVSGTMHGTVRGTLENIVVRGRNHESKAGLDHYPGGVIDGLCWPEGGNRDQDRAIYHPTGGDRTVIRHTCVAGLGNNGAYVDKSPVTVERSAFLNNNVANLRVGHADSDTTATSVIRDTLIAVTSRPRLGVEVRTPNPVGLRIRHPGRFVIENCWLVFTGDAPVADGLVELRGDDIVAEFRNTHFHNDSDAPLIADVGSNNEVTLTGCTASGRGRMATAATVSGSLIGSDRPVPLPSTVTGFPQADEAYGFDPASPLFDAGGEIPDHPGGNVSGDPVQTHEFEIEHRASLAGRPGEASFDYGFTVDGEVEVGPETESATRDSVDGGTEIRSHWGPDQDPPDDNYFITGQLVDFHATIDTADVALQWDDRAITVADLPLGDVPDGSGGGAGA